MMTISRVKLIIGWLIQLIQKNQLEGQTSTHFDDQGGEDVANIVTFVDGFFEGGQNVPLLDQVNRIHLLLKKLGKVLLVNVVHFTLVFTDFFAAVDVLLEVVDRTDAPQNVLNLLVRGMDTVGNPDELFRESR